jgi:heme-degrading monooxygenase HmoA
VPAAERQKGFKGVLLLTNPNTEKSIGITLWETEADMKAGEASGYYQEQVAKVASLLAGPPVLEHYEVSVRV